MNNNHINLFLSSYGEQYGSYPEQSAQSSELVSKQDDGGLFSALFSSVDRFFVGGAGLALPLAITLFAVDAVVSWSRSIKMIVKGVFYTDHWSLLNVPDNIRDPSCARAEQLLLLRDKI